MALDNIDINELNKAFDKIIEEAKEGFEAFKEGFEKYIFASKNVGLFDVRKELANEFHRDNN